MKPAVFLDRDGTLIDLVHHLVDPGDVRLLPRAGEAVRELRRRGYACVVVSNQSAIGRGLLTAEGLTEVHAELLRQLATHEAALDGFYFCPVKPEVSDPTVIEHPDRKPGPGMLKRAASELDLDLAQSWMIGDTLSDLLAGRNAGCKGTILVRTGYGKKTDPSGAADHAVDDVWAAAECILRLDSGAKKDDGGTA